MPRLALAEGAEVDAGTRALPIAGASAAPESGAVASPSVAASASSESAAADSKPVAAGPSPASKSAWTPSVTGFIQADAVLSRESSQDELDGSTGGPLNQTRFLIRRARIRLGLTHDFVWGGVELDGNTVDGLRAGLTEGDVGTKWATELEGERVSLDSALGLFKIPFGTEVPERDPDRFFLERSNASRALFPGATDLGGRLTGTFGPLSLVLAVMNGNPIGDKFLPARDANAAKDILGRLGVDTARESRVRFRMGVSALSGTGLHPGTPSTKDTLVWRDANENGRVELSEVQSIAGSAATVSQNFDRFALGSDVKFAVDLPLLGTLTIFGEVVFAKNLDRGLEPADPVSLGRDVREFGAHVAVTQEITRHAMIGIRYDRYNPDLDRSEQQGVTLVPLDRTYSTLAIAAALRHAPGRLVLEYERNDNTLGRTRSGLPTTLADDQIALRGEVVF